MISTSSGNYLNSTKNKTAQSARPTVHTYYVIRILTFHAAPSGDWHQDVTQNEALPIHVAVLGEFLTKKSRGEIRIYFRKSWSQNKPLSDSVLLA